MTSFREGLAAVTAASLYLGFPTIASVPQSIVKGFKNVLSLAAATDYSFTEAETLKALLAVSRRNISVCSS